MKKNFKAGFTLIELLVVIAIIGILASVVLASLNSARAKGADAAIKSGLANARAQAEIFYDGNGGTYTGVCAQTSGILPMKNAVANTAGSTNCSEASAGAGWAMWAPLKTSGQYCVDNTGASKTGTSYISGTTAC